MVNLFSIIISTIKLLRNFKNKLIQFTIFITLWDGMSIAYDENYWHYFLHSSLPYVGNMSCDQRFTVFHRVMECRCLNGPE
jgi:hypothetical protein